MHLFNLRTLSRDKFYTVPGSSALLILHKQLSSDNTCNASTCDQFIEEEGVDEDELIFELSSPIKFKQITRTTLTGNDNKPSYESHSLFEKHNSDTSNVGEPFTSQLIVSPSTSNGSLKNLSKISILELETMSLEAFKIDF